MSDNSKVTNIPENIVALFQAKYDLLKKRVPALEGAIEPGIYRTPDGGWQCNYNGVQGYGCAITLRPEDKEPHEVHGGICKRWYREGGAFDENGKRGRLGYPTSDEEAFNDEGDPNDRISHFENGDIIWTAKTDEIRVVGKAVKEVPNKQEAHKGTVLGDLVKIVGTGFGELFYRFCDVLVGTPQTNDIGMDVDDRLAGEEISRAYAESQHKKYNMLKSFLPQIGPFESGRHIGQGDSWIIDFGGIAAIVGTSSWNPSCFEVHGGIYSAWKESGGALGPLGRPVSDEADYHGPGARPGDCFSEFENGVIVWRADTGGTEVHVKTCLWHDEFDGTAIDSSKWSFEIGTGNNGWGNNEKEFYTDRPENAYVKDGILHIRAIKESCQGSDYTSARMVTKGKFSFTHGMVEARIALPSGKGIWPAFWMLGENIDSVGWPACGEIDIIEAINDENVVYGTCHWCNNGHVQHGKSTADFYGARFPLAVTMFHDYKLVWNEKLISMYVDGFKYNEMIIENDAGGTNAFHKPFFLILNVAVGGNWPGSEIDNSQFPNEMLVDYIRVSQLT